MHEIAPLVGLDTQLLLTVAVRPFAPESLLAEQHAMIEPPGAVKGSAHEVAAGVKAATAKMPGHAKERRVQAGIGVPSGGRQTALGGLRRGACSCRYPIGRANAEIQQGSTHTANGCCGVNHCPSCTAAAGRTHGKTMRSHPCPCKPALGRPCSAHSAVFAGFQPCHDIQLCFPISINASELPQRTRFSCDLTLFTN